MFSSIVSYGKGVLYNNNVCIYHIYIYKEHYTVFMTQISVTRKCYDRLKNMSNQTGRSMSSLVESATANMEIKFEIQTVLDVFHDYAEGNVPPRLKEALRGVLIEYFNKNPGEFTHATH